MAADQERWAKEREFFDDEEYETGPIPESTIRRYQLCLHPFTPAEKPFALLGDVQGKSIFELGCGDGVNSLLLAAKGAYVVGVDISPRAIEIAKQKARFHGLEDRTEFYALPVETYLEQDHSRFDIICGFAVLHHLLPVLDQILESLLRLGHPQTSYLFTEPIALSPFLRRLRLSLPIPVHATPDERPLEIQDLQILRQYLPSTQLLPQLLLGRFWNRFLGGRVEDYSSLRLALYHALCRADELLLRLPGMEKLAAAAILFAPPRSRH